MNVLASFARVYVRDLEAALAAFSASGVDNVRLRFDHAAGLQLALVGDILVLAGSDETIAPFRATGVTLIVDDLDDTLMSAVRAGATVVRDAAEQPVGRNATVAFATGPVIEYVEWNEATRAAGGI